MASEKTLYDNTWDHNIMIPLLVEIQLSLLRDLTHPSTTSFHFQGFLSQEILIVD